MKKVISIILCAALLGGLLIIPISAETINPFKDVSEEQFYFEPVLWAVEKGITDGVSDDEFAPEVACTRGQIVTFLWRAAGEPKAASTENPFKDVAEGAYYYDAVLWAVEKGITDGVSDDEFAPNDTCTRGQVVTFLWRANGKIAPAKKESPFADVQNESAYYYNPVLWAVENGITDGVGDNLFGYDQSCTRGQIVTFIYRYMTSNKPLEIVFQPQDYRMESSQEDAEFSVTIRGGSAPFTYQWITLYDNHEVKSDPVTTDNSIHVFTKEFSDYDFEDYRGIGVYCIITDSKGVVVESDLALVFEKDTDPISVATQPEDYFMRSSQENAEFRVELTGGAAPYTYRWVICFDNEEVALEPVTQTEPVHVLCYEFSDYDFDDYRDIGVYCVITDSKGQSAASSMAEVHPYSAMPLSILLQPQDYRMENSQEDAEFSVTIQGGTAPYSYQWIIAYDNEEVKLDPTSVSATLHTLRYEFSDYDFEDYNGIGVYCVITDSKGQSVTSSMAEVHPYSAKPLSILLHPQDYRMESSQEDAEFSVTIQGGTAPYSYQWIIAYDNEEVKLDPASVSATVHTLRYEFSDYDFEDYNGIGVYCVITDSKGSVVTSDFAEVLPKV